MKTEALYLILATGAISYRLAGVGGVVWPAALLTSGEMLPNGNALLEIRDSRLYRTSHGTFEDYCGEKWQIERRRAYQLMDAAQVVGNLNVNLGTQIGEKHVRPLTTLPPAAQREVWAAAKMLPNTRALSKTG